MIELVLFFLAGALSAGLVALLVMPAINSRAVRLYRRRLEAQLPRGIAEFAAAKDAVRAEMAAHAARTEHALDTTRERLVAVEAARARDRLEQEALKTEIASFEAAIVEYEARLDHAFAELRGAREALALAEADKRDLERRLAKASLTVEVHPLPPEGEQDPDMKRALADAEARIAELSRFVSDLASTELASIAAPLAASRPGPSRPPSELPEGPLATIEPARLDDLARRIRALRRPKASEDNAAGNAGPTPTVDPF